MKMIAFDITCGECEGTLIPKGHLTLMCTRCKQKTGILLVPQEIRQEVEEFTDRVINRKTILSAKPKITS